MKRILYIVNSNNQVWEFMNPVQSAGSTCIVVRKEFNSENIPMSKKHILKETGEQTEDIEGTISYQKLLEEIFSTDLSVVV